MVDLWTTIATFHREEFPNLLILAQLALTHPVHTADCERAFSSQNIVTTKLRNRLSGLHCDQLMRIMMEGPPRENFDFSKALKEWKMAKK